MKCDNFEEWLENRDLHDLSEADRAYRHAEQCERCCRLLKNDEQLDRFIARALLSDPVPNQVKNRIEISLDRAAPGRTRRGLFTAIAACLVFLVALITYQQGNEPHLFANMDELGGVMRADALAHGQDLSIFTSVTDPAHWFVENTGRPVQPPAALVAGYVVRGARFCTLGHCQAVHMVYEAVGGFVSLFVVDENELGFELEQDRLYTISMGNETVQLYRSGNSVFALVS